MRKYRINRTFRLAAVSCFCMLLALGLGLYLRRPAQCALCGERGWVRTYPCLLALGSGRAGELAVNDIDAAARSEIEQVRTSGSDTTMRFVLGRPANTYTDGEKSVTSVRLPGDAQRMKPRLYCRDCRKGIRAALAGDGADESGYILADLYDVEDVRFYPITDGAAYEIRGYTVETARAEDGWTVTVTGRTRPD